jgi:glycosyltransferase involved in cell wall biosynthesis
MKAPVNISPKKPKVLLFGPQLSAVGGGPTHLRNLLASSLSERYDIVHFEIGSRGRESPASEEGVLVRLPRLLWSPFLLVWRILTARPEVLHINTSLNHKSFWRDLGYLLIGRAFQRNVVIQVHGGSLERFCQHSLLLRLVSSWAFSIADAVVVLSSVEKESFEKIPSLKKLLIIPNAIRVEEYQQGSMNMRSGDVCRITYLGRLTREKGLFEAIDAMKMVASDSALDRVELTMAGSGSAHSDLASRIRELGLESRVRLVEPVFGADKVKFLQQSDVFLFPSYHEGLPYSVLESLAAGTPVIATKVGGIPDAVVDGVQGLLIDPKDPKQIVGAIRRLAADPALVRAMSQNCLSRSRDMFGLERLSKQFDQLYQSLIPVTN